MSHRNVGAFLLFAGFLCGQAQSPQTDPQPGVRKVRPLPAGATPVNTATGHPTTPSPAPATHSIYGATAAPSTNSKATPATRSSSAVHTKPVPSQGTDAPEDRAIEAAIRAKLAKSKIGADGFAVRVQGGVAFWSGQTDVVQHKGAATRMAKTAGARQVVNQIKVSDAGRQRASANLTEGRRRAQLKRGDPRSE